MFQCSNITRCWLNVECSNVPTMFQCFNVSKFQCSNVPISQDADWMLNVQMFQQCSNVSMFQCSNVQMFQCFNVPIFQWSNVKRCWLNFECSNVQIFKFPNVKIFQCLNVQMFKYSNIQFSNVQMSVRLNFCRRVPANLPNKKTIIILKKNQYIDQMIRKITNFKWILCNLEIFSKPKTIVKIRITDKTSNF